MILVYNQCDFGSCLVRTNNSCALTIKISIGYLTAMILHPVVICGLVQPSQNGALKHESGVKYKKKVLNGHQCHVCGRCFTSGKRRHNRLYRDHFLKLNSCADSKEWEGLCFSFVISYDEFNLL